MHVPHTLLEKEGFHTLGIIFMTMHEDAFGISAVNLIIDRGFLGDVQHRCARCGRVAAVARPAGDRAE